MPRYRRKDQSRGRTQSNCRTNSNSDSPDDKSLVITGGSVVNRSAGHFVQERETVGEIKRDETTSFNMMRSNNEDRSARSASLPPPNKYLYRTYPTRYIEPYSYTVNNLASKKGHNSTSSQLDTKKGK